MEHLLPLLFAGIGAILIYVGYQLFCELYVSVQQRASRATLILGNLLPGAILAMVGAGLVAAQVRTVLPKHETAPRHRSADREISRRISAA